MTSVVQQTRERTFIRANTQVQSLHLQLTPVIYPDEAQLLSLLKLQHTLFLIKTVD